MRVSQSVCIALLAGGMAQAQLLSESAYRALGQPDLNQNGINRVQGVEMYGPDGRGRGCTQWRGAPIRVRHA